MPDEPNDPDEPDSEPTELASPQALALRCPACSGYGYTARLIEPRDDGTIGKMAGVQCDLCKATGRVSRAAFARWHATKQGRKT